MVELLKTAIMRIKNVGTNLFVLNKVMISLSNISMNKSALALEEGVCKSTFSTVPPLPFFILKLIIRKIEYKQQRIQVKFSHESRNP